MSSKIVSSVLQILRRAGADAALLLDADPHGSEYPAPAWRLRSAATGFGGSAGSAVVLATGEAALWTDSRYFLAAEAALAGSGFELMREGEPGTPSIGQWISSRTGKAEGDIRFVADPLSLVGGFLVRAGLARARQIGVDNFTQLVWEDRPQLEFRPVRALDQATVAGEFRHARLERLAAVVRARGYAAALLSALDDIAWLLNLRGSDIAFNPLFHAWFLLSAAPGQPSVLWAGEGALGADIRAALKADGVEIRGYGDFPDDLTPIARRLLDAGGLWAHAASLPVGIVDLLASAGVDRPGPDLPIALEKARKNSTELANIRRAHLRDARALVGLFAQLDSLVRAGISEFEFGQLLDRARRDLAGEVYLGPSFDPIVGYLENGAIVHYRAPESGSKKLEPRGLLLVDSGAQFVDGTSDCTRTFSLGNPSPDEREFYTRVLKGHLRLGAARFPRGTSGVQLDTLARQDLWAVGKNYGHGTGHGVGFALCVHEGPLRISPAAGPAALEPGMVFSNEPGFYLAGSYGIRIENLVAVREDSEPGFLCFETLTLLPYERELIDIDLLDAREVAQIDAYHRRVLEELEAELGPEAASWLRDRCAPLVSTSL